LALSPVPFSAVAIAVAGAWGGPRLGLVELSVVEQRYRAVLAVKAGVPKSEVAAQAKVTRQTVHNWVVSYDRDGLGGLMDRSHRPDAHPLQIDPEMEALICEIRRFHPAWGPRRIVYELDRRELTSPARSTVYRVLVRHGLIEPKARRKQRREYRRWERAEPMALWQMDIVGGVMIDGPNGPWEAKVVTGVDDHSRYCVIATVVVRATGRAVCLAFAAALCRYGVPDEVLTDNGKQFTARFGRGGEVLFDRICRENGIAHRLTKPSSPTTTGKVERFHQTLRRELLNGVECFPSIEAAQGEIDAFVVEYNTVRPHQSLDMATPASRFRPGMSVLDDTAATTAAERLLPLHLPGILSSVPALPAAEDAAPPADSAVPPNTGQEPPEATVSVPATWEGGPVEFDRVVPASGNMAVCNRQFWFGRPRAGLTVTFWASVDVLHVTSGGHRIKTLRSHLSMLDLAALVAKGARPAGPPPIPVEPGTAVEVERLVRRNGTISLGDHQVSVGEINAGRQVGIRIDGDTLLVFDPETRELLRSRTHPLTSEEVIRLRGARPAGTPPKPRTSPFTVQRRASATGVITVAGQHIALGRKYAGHTVAIHVSGHVLTIDVDDDQKTVVRTTTKPIRQEKAHRPHQQSTPPKEQTPREANPYNV
jgi:transposase InsO family protein